MSQPIKATYGWNRNYLPTGGAEKVYLLLELEGVGGISAARAPINLSLVLDRSGSMNGQPLEYSKLACQFVVEQMNAGDLLSMVAFDNRVDTVFKPEKVTHKDLMKMKIKGIESGGNTNLSGGLIQGAQYVVEHKHQGMVQRVILLSDGQANAGITEQDRLATVAREFYDAGVSITAMGVGSDFDEELMEAISESGGGNFYYIEKLDDIPTYFQKELQGLLTVVAQNVLLRLKPSDKTIVTGIYGYKAEDYNGSLGFTLGDVYSGEIKSLLLEITCYPHSEGEHSLLEVEWTYTDVTQSAQYVKVGKEIKAHFTSNIDLINEPRNAHVEKQVHITESALALEKAMGAFDMGDHESGQNILKEQADKMLLHAIQSNDPELREESQLLYDTLENFEYSAKTRKGMHQQKYNNLRRKKQ